MYLSRVGVLILLFNSLLINMNIIHKINFNSNLLILNLKKIAERTHSYFIP